MTVIREFEQREPYADYATQKGWVSDYVAEDEAYYDALWTEAGLGAGQRILEIGFGAGSFLDWALSHGHKPIGVDILPEILASTAARGHDVRQGPLRRETFTTERFDVVCAFDVFEHLTAQGIHEYIGICLDLFDGPPRFLLRFPNGESPLSSVHQNSDLTHKTILSLSIINQILFEHNLHARALIFKCYPTGILKKIRRMIAYILQFMISTLLGLAYFGGKINLNVNLEVLVTERPR